MKSRENRKEYWQKHLAAFNSSGLSQKAYCRQTNIGYCSFNQWKRRIENSQERASITEVTSRPVMHDSTSPKDMIVIHLNNTIQISLPGSISHETLITILKSVGEYTCR
jgi:hypothetical protein